MYHLSVHNNVGRENQAVDVVSEGREAEQSQKLIGRAWCILPVVADIGEKWGDKQHMKEIHPECCRASLVTDECLVGVIHKNKGTETQKDRIKNSHCVRARERYVEEKRHNGKDVEKTQY